MLSNTGRSRDEVFRQSSSRVCEFFEAGIGNWRRKEIAANEMSERRKDRSVRRRSIRIDHDDYERGGTIHYSRADFIGRGGLNLWIAISMG